MLLLDRHGDLYALLDPAWHRESSPTNCSTTAMLVSVISVDLPNGPVLIVSGDCFSPLPIADRGNTYILLLSGRFSRDTSMNEVTAADFTAVGAANISSTTRSSTAVAPRGFSLVMISRSVSTSLTHRSSSWPFAIPPQALATSTISAVPKELLILWPK